MHIGYDSSSHAHKSRQKASFDGSQEHDIIIYFIDNNVYKSMDITDAVIKFDFKSTPENHRAVCRHCKHRLSRRDHCQ